MRKAFAVMGILFSGVCVASRPVTQPEWLGRIRKDHPRMFFNAEM